MSSLDLDNHIFRIIAKKNPLDYKILSGKGDFDLNINESEFREIEKKRKELNVEIDNLSIYIQNLLRNAHSKVKTKILNSVNPLELSKNSIVQLVAYVNRVKIIEELLCIGENEYLLTSHNRGALIKGDILKTKTSPWMPKTNIKFEVYRNGKRHKEGDKDIYETLEIFEIVEVEAPALFRFYDEN